MVVRELSPLRPCNPPPVAKIKLSSDDVTMRSSRGDATIVLTSPFDIASAPVSQVGITLTTHDRAHHPRTPYTCATRTWTAEWLLERREIR